MSKLRENTCLSAFGQASGKAPGSAPDSACMHAESTPSIRGIWPPFPPIISSADPAVLNDQLVTFMQIGVVTHMCIGCAGPYHWSTSKAAVCSCPCSVRSPQPTFSCRSSRTALSDHLADWIRSELVKPGRSSAPLMYSRKGQSTEMNPTSGTNGIVGTTTVTIFATSSGSLRDHILRAADVNVLAEASDSNHTLEQPFPFLEP